MNARRFIMIFICVLSFAFKLHVQASTWTSWTEYPTDPVYDPGKAYYPSVIFNANKFNNNSALYKMWYEGNNEIGLAYSEDGINWVQQSTTGLPAVGAHPDVIYDPNGFGGGPYNYKMWFWDPSASLDSIDAIKYSTSTDGVNWTTPISITQNPASPLVTGVSPGYFYHLYGPGYVIFTPNATSTPGQPLTFPYIMFFDTSTEGLGPGTSVEQIGLAYSSDGIFWTLMVMFLSLFPRVILQNGMDNIFINHLLSLYRVFTICFTLDQMDSLSEAMVIPLHMG